MEAEHFSIAIDGQETEDLYEDLLSVEVELDDTLAAMFRLTIAIGQDNDGIWSYLDDERLHLWKEVTISAGFGDETDDLITGYITHVRPHFTAEPTGCLLEVWGMDGSVLMDREEKLKDWPNKKDSDIAAEIFGLYGLSAETENTAVIHDEAVSTIIQRETDIQFLKRLALRNGFECYVDGRTGYFRPPEIAEAPQPTLAVHFGDETTVVSLLIEANALTPANVAMCQVDRTSKEVLESVAESSLQTPLGSMAGTRFIGAGVPAGKAYIGMSVATGNPEMTALCQGLYHDAEWFVTGEGEIRANEYGHVLKPRRTVTIKGLGETHSGVYYVCSVNHVFGSDGYTQTFKVKRNAVAPTGNEDFSVASGGLLGELV
jgi:phage protein D